MKRTGHGRSWAAFIAVLCLLPAFALSGDLTTDNMTVASNATVYGKLSVSMTNTAPTNGLRLYYSFDTNTTPVPDNSGYAHTGNVYGATWVAGGITGGAYSFDGSDDYIQVPSAADLNITTSITVSFWMNFDTSRTDYMMPITRNNTGDTANAYWVMQIQTNNSPSREFNWVVYYNIGGTGAATGDEWTHVAIVQSNTTATVYVNGTAVQTASANSIPSASKDILLGRRSDSGGTWFKGRLDEIRIYNRPLSGAEVRGLYADFTTMDNSVTIDGGIEYVPAQGELFMGSFTNSL